MARIAFPLSALLLLSGFRAWGETAEVIWYDGTRSAPPPGKLLSDNAGFWGEQILTGVEYTYETPPESPRDILRDNAQIFGRRLLDGQPAGNWWTPVGRVGPLTVIFDFKRPCVFREVDIDTRSKRLALRLETAEAPEGPWRIAYERSLAESPEQQLHRIVLAPPAQGQYLRVTAQAQGTTWLEEVLVWGEATVTEELPEYYAPLQPEPVASEISATSLPGAAGTAFSDAMFWDWQRDIGAWARQPAVWSRLSTWGPISHQPLLPKGAEIQREGRLLLARNETECMALALTNTSWTRPLRAKIALSPFYDASGRPAPQITGTVRVAGTIPSRYYGVTVGPLFSADNLLPAGLMQRYLTNGAGIKDFPQILLPRAGSAVLWISVQTAHARPGRYYAILRCGHEPTYKIYAEVVNVTLPRPRVWLQTWSRITTQFPFTTEERLANEVAYKRSLGVTVWHGFPEPGSIPERGWEKGRSFFHIWGIGDYGHKLYNNQIDPNKLTDEDAAKIAELIQGHVRTAQRLGLKYEDWYVELADEPGKGNAALFGALARLIRKADPRVYIYCNPSFWMGTGVLEDKEVYDSLKDWYRECVDVSCPIYLLLRERPQTYTLFDAPRLVRAFYHVSTQSAKCENAATVELYRKMAWEAVWRGWNGWGFYSYYAPLGNPWNDMDEAYPDYIMVYPGPRGPIPTRPSEAVREGWEDYCLLTLLREQGKTRALQALLSAFAAGESPAVLRERALRVAAQ